MKKLLLLFTISLTTAVVSAQAIGDTTVSDNITYTITNDAPFQAEVSGFDDKDNIAASITIPASVTISGEECSIVAIGIGAFGVNEADNRGAGDGRNIGLTEVSLPSSVVAIGAHAFRENPNLTTINMSDLTSTGSNAFASCTGLTTIGDLTSIVDLGDFTFSQCTALTNIVLPVVETIGTGALSIAVLDTSGGLTSFNVPSTVTSIGNNFLGRYTELTEVSVNWTSFDGLTISTNNFFRNLDQTTITLKVPVGTLALYSADDSMWKDFIIEEVAPLSIDDVNELNTNIYPNPTNGNVFVKIESQEDIDLTIYDLTGKVLSQVKGKQIDFSSLTSGVYILKGETSEGQFTERIVKK